MRIIFISFIFLAVLLCCDKTPSSVGQILGSYDIVSVMNVVPPWQDQITSIEGRCADREVELITASGGVWRTSDDSTYHFVEDVYPKHQLSAVDDSTGDLAFYINGQVLLWSQMAVVKTVSVPVSQYTDVHYHSGHVVLVDDARLVLVNTTTGTAQTKAADVKYGVHFSDRYIAYARLDSLFVSDLADGSEVYLQDVTQFTIIGLEDDVVGLSGQDSLKLISRSGFIARFEFPYQHRILEAHWDDSTMLILGTDSTVVNILYQVDLNRYQVTLLGPVTGFENKVLWEKDCGAFYVASSPTSIRKYTRGFSDRFVLKYNYASVYAAILSISQETESSVSVVALVDAPSMPTDGKKLFYEIRVDTSGQQGVTKVITAQEEGEYPQVVLREGSVHQYLVTNKRVCALNPLDSVLWRSSETVTSACLQTDAVVVGNLSGFYRIDRSSGQVDTLFMVDTQQYVPIHLSCDATTGIILAVESNSSKNTRRRHRIFSDKSTTLLAVPGGEKYSASFISNGEVLLIGQQSIGLKRVTYILRGSIMSGNYSILDSSIVNFPISPQVSATGRVYSIGAAYSSIVLQYRGDFYLEYKMKVPNPFFRAFTVGSQLTKDRQYFGVNFTYAPQLVRIRVDSAVTNVDEALSRNQYFDAGLRLVRIGNEVFLKQNDVQVAGRITVFTLNGSRISVVEGGRLNLSALAFLARGQLLVLGEYGDNRTMIRLLTD